MIHMQAGPEIGVAATKTFVTQMACGILLALRLADSRGELSVDHHRELAEQLLAMPDLLARALAVEPQIVHMAGSTRMRATPCSSAAASTSRSRSRAR